MHSSHINPQDNIETYLNQHQQKDLLRFLTCGSVDDGKSTLIGRLLHDSKGIYEDQLAAITKDSKKVGTTGDEVDLALLVDGLQSEREQGITIDVAYRYFSTEKRKFIIADTPGHEQYTRNMVTGASNCELAIILIDARYGLQTQTRRHSFICSLLGIKQIIVAVNKMDLVEYQESVFQQISKEYLAFAEQLSFDDIRLVPLSALKGDNVVSATENMPWYKDGALISHLDDAEVGKGLCHQPMRFPVQYVNRPDLDYRGFCGTLSSGEIALGDTVVALPSGQKSVVSHIDFAEKQLQQAQAGQAITLRLADEIDISRGDMLVKPEQVPHLASGLQSWLVWMSETPLESNREYEIKFASKRTVAKVTSVNYQVDVNTLQKQQTEQLKLNEIAVVDVALGQAVAFDDYAKNRATGAFILIDRITNATLAAGMVIQPVDIIENSQNASSFSEFELELNALIRKHFPHWEAKDLKGLLG